MKIVMPSVLRLALMAGHGLMTGPTSLSLELEDQAFAPGIGQNIGQTPAWRRILINFSMLR
jgi:hypothetical protein